MISLPEQLIKVNKNYIPQNLKPVELNPDAPEIFFKYGLHCIGCHVALWETIEEGCMGHGMPDEKIDELIEELNKKPKK